MEDLLRSSNIVGDDKEELVKKYTDLLVSKGFIAASQIRYLTETRFVEYGFKEAHAIAVAEAVENYNLEHKQDTG